MERNDDYYSLIKDISRAFDKYFRNKSKWQNCDAEIIELLDAYRICIHSQIHNVLVPEDTIRPSGNTSVVLSL